MKIDTTCDFLELRCAKRRPELRGDKCDKFMGYLGLVNAEHAGLNIINTERFFPICPDCQSKVK